MLNDDVVVIIKDIVKELSMVFKRLVMEVVECGSCDNIMVIVVFFKFVLIVECVY